MGHKNYTKYSENSKETKKEEVIEATSIVSVVDPEEVVEVEATMETTVEATEPVVEVNEYIVKGIVVECDKLNVRKEPSKEADVLCVLNKGDEVQVDLKIDGEPEISDVSFYKVFTASGVEGYCMVDFIETK